MIALTDIENPLNELIEYWVYFKVKQGINNKAIVKNIGKNKCLGKYLKILVAHFGKDAGCSTELDYAEQSSWILFVNG